MGYSFVAKNNIIAIYKTNDLTAPDFQSDPIARSLAINNKYKKSLALINLLVALIFFSIVSSYGISNLLIRISWGSLILNAMRSLFVVEMLILGIICLLNCLISILIHKNNMANERIKKGLLRLFGVREVLTKIAICLFITSSSTFFIAALIMIILQNILEYWMKHKKAKMN